MGIFMHWARCFRMSSARTSIWSCSAEMWRLDPCRSKQSKNSRDIPSPSDLFGATQIDSWSNFDGIRESAEPMDTWSAGRLRRVHRDFLSRFETSLEIELSPLGLVLCCHAAPRVTNFQSSRRAHPMK